MPIRFQRVNIRRNENLFVDFEGSSERSIFIEVDGEGIVLLRGPMNHNGRTFMLVDDGIEQVPAVKPIVHGLSQGLAVCQFVQLTPQDWPPGHVWVTYTELAEITCHFCRMIAEERARVKAEKAPGKVLPKKAAKRKRT